VHVAYICGGRPGNAALARRRSDLAENELRRSGSASAGRGASPEPTLDELAQKLSDLREHLREVLTGFNRGVSGERIGGAGAAQSSLRCHGCSRDGSTHEDGWTLHLCADDELHPFCPDCDRRRVNGKAGSRAGAVPQGTKSGRDAPMRSSQPGPIC
jgi:hypothetical protein